MALLTLPGLNLLRLELAMGLAMLLVLGGCQTLPLPVRTQAASSTAPSTGSESDARRFHVVSHGRHTGVVVPAADLARELPELKARFPNRRFLEIGWGDAGFYQAEEITVGIALQAMFIPTTAVVHVVGFDDAPEHQFASSELAELTVSAPAYADLLRYLASSFAQDANGHLTMQGRGLYGDGQFYTGVGNYTLINTCNKWTAKALYSAGLPISTAFKLTAGSVMRSVRDAQAGGPKGREAIRSH